MNQNYRNQYYYDHADFEEGKRSYFLRTYRSMGIGLLLTFLTAYVTAAYLPWIAYSPLMFVLVIGQLALVVALNKAIATAEEHTVQAMFIGYACLTGVTLSSIFLAFDLGAIFQCFFATAAAFGGMAAVGTLTKKDLSPWSSSLMGALIGLIVLGIVGSFLRFPLMDQFISALGIVVFMGLTAFDHQKLSQMYDLNYGGNSAVAERYSVYAALQLYLDFLNLFLYLVRFMGNRRRD